MMIKKTSFLIEESVHERLKALAAENGLTVGGQIRRFVDQAAGKPDYTTPEYKKWIYAVCKVGSLHGDEAAQKFIAENPAPR